MTNLDELLASIFDGKQSSLYSEFEMWARGSRRFKAFASTYRDKIRAKLKNVRDEGGMKDLRAELETAMLLLRQERFAVEYETYAASKQRGPDFTVTFKTHTRFNVEVRRLRRGEMNDANSAAGEGMSDSKLMAVLCEKVGQMPPSIINFLWFSCEREISQEDLTRVIKILLQLAERQAQDYFARFGFERPADFLKSFRQLSGIVLHRANENRVWLNALAKHQAPKEIVTAIGRLSFEISRL